MYQVIIKDNVYDSEYAANQLIERRKSKRIDVNKKAMINLAGLSVCSCIVKDVSNTGARILVSNHSWVPRQFLIDGLLPDERILVSQVWQEGEQIGVEFSNVTWLSEWIDEQQKSKHANKL